MPPDKREMNKAPSMCTFLAPPSVGEHVYRLHLRAANGKYLGVEMPTHLLSAKLDAPGPECVFELHRAPDGRYAIRSAFGKFLNVDDNIDLALKEKSSKDLGLKADRDAVGDVAVASLGEREKSFEIVELPNSSANGGAGAEKGNMISIRGPDDFFLAVEAGETKTRVVRNAVAAAYTAGVAAANAAQAAASSAAAAAAAAAAVTPATPASLATVASTAAAASSAAATAAATQPPPAPSSFSPSPAEIFTAQWIENRSPLTLQGRVVISTAHGKYFCVEPSGNLIANRRSVSLWEPLTIVPQSLTHVAFLSAHGDFLTLRAGGGASSTQPELSFTSSVPSLPEAQFEVVEFSRTQVAQPSCAKATGGVFAFRAANGRFLSAEGNHTVTAGAKEAGAWEQFTLTPWNHTV